MSQRRGARICPVPCHLFPIPYDMAGIEIHALAKNIRMTPRKVRLVGEAVKGKPLNEALALLHFMPHRASTPVLKVVKSAAANAENNFDLDPNDLYIVRVVADPARSLRRFRAKARGRVGSLHKRSSHITVVVQEKEK